MESEDNKFDFNIIINSISNEIYLPNYYDLDEVGTLYTYDVKSLEDDVRITSGIHDNQILEVYILGENIELNINAYSDGELTKETDKYSYELKTEEVSIRDYINKEVEIYSEQFVYDDYIAEKQIFNLYSKTLDEMIGNNVVNLWIDELFSIGNLDRIFVLLYDVEFSPQSLKDISVSYYAKSTMDRTETKDPLYSFEYLLNPAKNWANFKNLSIEITPLQEHPYIVDSSVELVKNEDGIYTGEFESLPDEDLSFTLYSKDEITFMDKVERQLYNLIKKRKIKK